MEPQAPGFKQAKGQQATKAQSILLGCPYIKYRLISFPYNRVNTISSYTRAFSCVEVLFLDKQSYSQALINHRRKCQYFNFFLQTYSHYISVIVDIFQHVHRALYSIFQFILMYVRVIVCWRLPFHAPHHLTPSHPPQFLSPSCHPHMWPSTTAYVACGHLTFVWKKIVEHQNLSGNVSKQK